MSGDCPTCELFNRPFQSGDVYGVDFAKIDIEGGEVELLNVPAEMLPSQVVMETHASNMRKRMQEHLPDMKLLHQYTVEPETIVWRWLRKHDSELTKTSPSPTH
jgi:hypothetical protein